MAEADSAVFSDSATSLSVAGWLHALTHDLSNLTPSPAAEARTIAAWCLGIEVSRLGLASPPTRRQRAQAAQFVAGRAAGKPLQHLTGVACFRYLSVAVGPGVFIPRPETELLAGWTIDWLNQRATCAPGLVVELCAGSGAISAAICDEAPGHRQVAVELSLEAWPWLERNLSGRPIERRRGDLATAVDDLAGEVDLLVVNPPYVPTTTVLPDDVVGHDPAIALFGGPDGLAVIRVIAEVAARVLKPGGAVACEHDQSHAAQVRELFVQAGLVGMVTHRDLAGRERFTTARAWQDGHRD